MSSDPCGPARDSQHEEYLAHLHVPTDEEFLRIAKSQAEREHAAAVRIQREYRGYRDRREAKGHRISAQKLSETQKLAVKHVQYLHLTSPESRSSRDSHGTSDSGGQPRKSHSSGVQNWQRATAITLHAMNDDPDDDFDDDASDGSDRRKSRLEEREARSKTAKMMSLRYFLEMVDVKHRYGSNLRAYHQQWQKSNTNENFFYWLDYGEGKDVELTAVSRKRLDTEQVRYLSREERLHYLVEIDQEGRLCWAKNGERIDTTQEYKDSMEGIVAMSNNTAVSFSSAHRLGEPGSHSSESSNSDLSGTDDEAQRYSNQGLKKKAPKKLITVSPAVILNKLLRKTVKKNTWIFVADTSFRLYVGIKQSGAFQHSSFLNGSRLSAAGLIEVEDGLLRALSPLSGHYRPPASNFRDFVQDLKKRSVDMSHVSISKSYAVLVGLEAYASGRRKVKKTKNAIGKLGRKTNKDKEILTGDGRKLTEDEIALKEEYDGGLDDHQPLTEAVKDIALAAPALAMPKFKREKGIAEEPEVESPLEIENPMEGRAGQVNPEQVTK